MKINHCKSNHKLLITRLTVNNELYYFKVQLTIDAFCFSKKSKFESNLLQTR